MRGLGPILGRYRGRMLAAIALAVVSQVFLALGPLVQSVILDDAVLADQRPLAPWIALLIAVGLVSFVTNYGRRRLGGRAAVDVQRDLQVAVHHHMQYLDPARRDQLRTGDIMSRATSDITLIQVFLQQLAMIDRKHRPAGELAGDHAVPVAAAGRGDRRVRAAVRVAVQPLPHPFVPRQLDGPALPGRGRRRGGGGGHRGAHRQGVRAGAAELDLLTDTATTLYRSRMRHGADHRPLRRSAAGDPDARATRRPRLRWLAGDRGADLARRAPRLRHATSCSSSRRCGCSPPSSPRASRRGPAPTGCSSCSTSTGRARRSRRPGRRRTRGARSTSTA